MIGQAIVDFFCPQKGLIVEVDGETHESERDAVRDAINAHYGYETIRFSNADVGKNIECVTLAILEKLNALPDRWPHPTPSPKCEGTL